MSCENNPNKAAKAAKDGGVPGKASKSSYNLGSSGVQQPLFAEEVGRRPKLEEHNRKMLEVMMDMGVNPAVVGALLEMAGYSKKHVRYLTGPIVVYDSPWKEDLPSWLPKAIYKERLERILAEEDAGYTGDLATPTEVVAYLHPASLEIPFSHEWTRVYLWAGNEAFRKHGRLPEGRTFWEIVDSPPIELTRYERRYHLMRLQRDIRRSVVSAAKRQEAKARRRGTCPERSRREDAQVSLTANAGQQESIQLDLFGHPSDAEED